MILEKSVNRLEKDGKITKAKADKIKSTDKFKAEKAKEAKKTK
jgi:hypothetical protein